MLHHCSGIAHLVPVPPIRLDSRAVKGHSRNLIARERLNGEVERAVCSLNGLLIRSGTSHAARIRNAHGVLVEVGHDLMVTGAHEVDEGELNVFLCAGHRYGIGVFRELGDPLFERPPALIVTVIVDLGQCHNNSLTIIERGGCAIALIVSTRNRHRLIVNLERVKIPVRTLLPANSAEGEGQIIANSNVRLVGNCAVAHHSVSVGRVANRIGNGEVVCAVCAISNVNRDVFGHVGNRIHAVVAREGLASSVNAHLISVHISYGEVERAAINYVGCTGHKAVRIGYAGNVVGNVVAINMLLVSKRDLLSISQL